MAKKQTPASLVPKRNVYAMTAWQIVCCMPL